MDSHAQLESLTDARSLDALTDTSPESRIKQDHVDSGIEYVCCQLLEANYYSISCQRHAYFLSRPAHTIQAKDRILEVVILNIFDLLTEPDGLFGRPDRVWIETKTVTIEFCSQGPITLQLIFGSEYAAF